MYASDPSKFPTIGGKFSFLFFSVMCLPFLGRMRDGGDWGVGMAPNHGTTKNSVGILPCSSMHNIDTRQTGAVTWIYGLWFE